jgi:hypothetical protein
MSQQTNLTAERSEAGSNSIACPKCGTSISITEALSADIRAHYKKEFQQIIFKRNQEIKSLQSAIEKDKELLNQERKNLEEMVVKRVQVEKTALEQKIRQDLLNQNQLEMQDLRNQLIEKNQCIEKAQAYELELRKKAREIEEREKVLELELQRKFDVEKLKIQEETSSRILNDQQLKMAEKDKQLDDLRRQIEGLKRKAEQGSQQIQGEVLEVELESILCNLFALDSIEPVSKGMKGGDIIQRIVGFSGQCVGTIIWETKRTKNWSDGWIEKLKEDQRAIAAECAIIVTQTMPKEELNLAMMDGIFVVDFQTFKGLAVTLRHQLIQLFQARAMAISKGEKLDFLYDYLTGTQLVLLQL